MRAAAIEGAFRAVGLAALFGSETLPDLAEALWDEALGLVFEAPGALPGPRIEHATLEPSEPGVWMLGRGAFFVAALAFGEGSKADRPPARLCAVAGDRAPGGPAGCRCREGISIRRAGEVVVG